MGHKSLGDWVSRFQTGFWRFPRLRNWRKLNCKITDHDGFISPHGPHPTRMNPSTSFPHQHRYQWPTSEVSSGHHHLCANLPGRLIKSATRIVVYDMYPASTPIVISSPSLKSFASHLSGLRIIMQNIGPHSLEGDKSIERAYEWRIQSTDVCYFTLQYHGEWKRSERVHNLCIIRGGNHDDFSV